jgi:hypothetical protein
MQFRSSKIAAELALQIMANLSQISNLSIKHMQKVYEPEIQKEDEGTVPDLSFIDRMIGLCQLNEAAKCGEYDTPRSPIFESDQNERIM